MDILGLRILPVGGVPSADLMPTRLLVTSPDTKGGFFEQNNVIAVWQRANYRLCFVDVGIGCYFVSSLALWRKFASFLKVLSCKVTKN